MNIFEDEFLTAGRALLRRMGVPDDFARIYLRLVPLRLMGIDEKTAIKLACAMEDAPQRHRLENRSEE